MFAPCSLLQNSIQSLLIRPGGGKGRGNCDMKFLHLEVPTAGEGGGEIGHLCSYIFIDSG